MTKEEKETTKEGMAQQEEVDRNYESFKEQLSDLMKTDPDRFALMHNREVIACFDTNRDALQAGEKLLEGKLFSIQRITNHPVDLGYFSHAGILRAV